ncbi:unnamed protein product, partial [Scytosiphon promiscuus]
FPELGAGEGQAQRTVNTSRLLRRQVNACFFHPFLELGLLVHWLHPVRHALSDLRCQQTALLLCCTSTAGGVGPRSASPQRRGFALVYDEGRQQLGGVVLFAVELGTILVPKVRGRVRGRYHRGPESCGSGVRFGAAARGKNLYCCLASTTGRVSSAR